MSIGRKVVGDEYYSKNGPSKTWTTKLCTAAPEWYYHIELKHFQLRKADTPQLRTTDTSQPQTCRSQQDYVWNGRQ